MFAFSPHPLPHISNVRRLTLLMWAAAYGRADTVRFLLARGAKPEARDNRGQTAREMAIAGGHLATAQLLQPR